MSSDPSELTILAPRGNPELRDHGRAEQSLLRAFRCGRLPHAWLITGARGIGKATLAYRFARFVLAEGGAGGGAGDLFGGPGSGDNLWLDPESEVFRRVAAQGHGDLRVLERGRDENTGKMRREIVVKEVRAISSFLRMTASDGGWRIVIVDPADALNPSAANALLKVLEEPPDKALLLLVAHTPGRIMATIRSRCCRLALDPLGESTVVALLRQHLTPPGDMPGAAAAPGDAIALARLSEGSIGRALALASGGGLELYRELVEVMAGLPELDVPRVHALGDRLARDADDTAFQTGTDLFAWWLARMIRSGAEGSLPPEVVAGEGALMARLLERRGLAQWLELWEKVTRLFARADLAKLDRKQVILTAFLELEAVAS